MPVYLSTSIIGNDDTLLTLGHAAEIMGWFYPSKDQAQNIHQCLPCVYVGPPRHGHLHWTYGDEWQRHQAYDDDSNICVTTLLSDALGIHLTITDVVPPDDTVLVRQIAVRNIGTTRCVAGIFHYGDWNLGGLRTGNALRFDPELRVLLQSHREVAAAIGGDALETWQCGKAGIEWGNNARHDLQDGALLQQDLEIGDVNWAFGFAVNLHASDTMQRTAIFALGRSCREAITSWQRASEQSFTALCARRREADASWLQPGLAALEEASQRSAVSDQRSAVSESALTTHSSSLTTHHLPTELLSAYKRSLLCLPLLCGREGVAIAAPEFDPEFISCGGYGYFWPRDGAEYVGGLMDAGYPEFATRFFDWCAHAQDTSGLWHQRYFLNGAPGPNWCLPPDMLQIDQVGAVLWAYGKYESADKTAAQQNPPDHYSPLGAACPRAPGAPTYHSPLTTHQQMVRQAADYLLSRLTERGVHANAFDTWESFIGSFTYSNAALYAAFKTAAKTLDDAKYEAAAARVKQGVLEHFVRDDSGYPFLMRGFDSHGESDVTVDSASLGAIEPFGLLDLRDERDLRLAEGTLRAITEKLEVDWEGGRAIRRFEGDAYVGGVPACVNTLWMARCCLKVAERLREIGRHAEADELIARAQGYLMTVLRRSTPTGLLPELMQGPTGQRYWAAPHGWAMASFVSGVLMLARALAGTI